MFSLALKPDWYVSDFSLVERFLYLCVNVFMHVSLEILL